MRIAIPVFGANISPRFDCASSVLMVDVTDGAVTGRRMEAVEPFLRRHQLDVLRRKGVEVLLCGGIRRCDYFWLVRSGITVHAGLVGEVEELITAYLQGKIQSEEPDRTARQNHARRRRASRRH